MFIGHQWAKSELVCEHNPNIVRAKVACTLTPQLSEIKLIDNMYAVGDTIYDADPQSGEIDYQYSLQFIVLEKAQLIEKQ